MLSREWSKEVLSNMEMQIDDACFLASEILLIISKFYIRVINCSITVSFCSVELFFLRNITTSNCK